MAKLLNPQAFAEFLIACAAAKHGYIMCAVGQDPRTLSEWYFSGQYSGKQLTQARYWREHAAQVFDCQGLADYYTSANLGQKINVKARDNYANWCGIKGTGMIPVEYRVPGAAVFMNSSYVHHVGYLVKPVDAAKPDNDWYVIEARGVMYGVQMYKYSERPEYNRWGLMDKYFDYTGVLAQYNGTTPTTHTLGSRLLKSGMTGSDVSDLKEALAQLGYGPLAATDKYDADTVAAVKAFQRANYDLEVDGIYGELTHAALMAALDEAAAEEPAPEAPKKTVRIISPGTWNVRKGPGTSYGTLSTVKQGTELPYVSTAGNGWIQVEINGTTGWVSGNCAVVGE